MKAKLHLLVLLMLAAMAAQAQSIVLEFNAHHSCAQVSLDSIWIQNLTQGGKMVLYYPSNIAVLIVTDIDDFDPQHNHLYVSQNYPNPFSALTYIDVYLTTPDVVSLNVYDLTGRTVARHEDKLEEGMHRFSFSAGVEKTYILNVTSGKHIEKRIMLQMGLSGSAVSEIRYLGASAEEEPKTTPKSSDFNFNPGDNLRFTGFVTDVNGNTDYGVINDAPEESTEYLFDIANTPPSKPSEISGEDYVPANATGLVYEVQEHEGLAYLWSVPDGWNITQGQGSNSITVDAGDQGGNISVTAENNCGMSEASVLTVEVYVPMFELILLADPTNGGDVTGAGSYPEGENVIISTTPEEGWQFVNWVGDTEYLDDAGSAEAIVTMPAYDIALTAEFQLEDLADGLICNGDFENWTDGLPDCWYGDKSNIPTSNVVQHDANPYTGSYALQLINTDDGHRRFTSQPTSVESGETYQITFFVKGHGEIRTGLFDDRGTAFGYAPYNAYINVNSDNWTEHSQTITAANTTDIAEFIFSLRNTNEAMDHILLDYVTVEEFLVEPDLYNLHLEVHPEGAGTIYGEGEYEEGELVNISATTNAGWEFINWTGDTQYLDDVDSPLAVVTMPAVNITLTASFQEEDSDIIYGDGVTDIDDNYYVTVIIGNQEWMAENLRVTRYNNEDDIPTGLSNTEWSNTTSGAYAIYNNDDDMLEAYGKLYNWYAVDDARGLCPEGWSVPSHDDWTQLEQYICNALGNSDCETHFPYDNTTLYWRGTNEGNALKSCRQVGSPLEGCNTSEHPRWYSNITHYGFDEFGFSALPGGFRLPNGNCSGIGYFGIWWSSSEYSSAAAWLRYMHREHGNVYRNYDIKQFGFSVRCFRDITEEPTLYNLNLQVHPDGAGTVYGEGEYEEGEVVNVTAIAHEGWEFVNWTGDIGHIDDTNSETATVTMPAQSISLVAIFEENFVTTLEATDITHNSVIAGGVIGDGSYSVLLRGLVWGTSSPPDFNDNYTEDGSGPGIFTSTLVGLEPGDTYYVKAYASTNPGGVTFGNQIEFTTLATSAVVSIQFVYVTIEATTVHANVSYDGGDPNTLSGLVWSTHPNPTVDQHEGISEDGTGEGQFVSVISSLDPHQLYYLRAYVVNSADTSYSAEHTFNTIGYYGTVTDVDNNIYNTILIGDREWMAENLRVTRYSNGLPIQTGLSNADWQATTNGAYAIYPHDNVNGINSYEEMIDAYGKIYNWYAINDQRGLCPTGWYIPSDDELLQLYNFLSEGNQYVGNRLKSCRQDNSPIGGNCSTSVHPRWDFHGTHFGLDEYGFSALPGGKRTSNGLYSNLGQSASFWTSTSHNGAYASNCNMNYDSADIALANTSNKATGLSVRCVKVYTTLPFVATTKTYALDNTSLYASSQIYFEGGYPVTSRGFVWSQSPEPTIESNDGMTIEGSGLGSFSSIIENLTLDNQYYIRAYAINDVGLTYGEEEVFNTLPPYYVVDINKNIYNVVIIGNQMWMAENLRVSKYSSGDTIPTGLSNTEWENTIEGAYTIYDHNGWNTDGINSSEEMVAAYGKLYNWYAVDDARGICPEGWSVPDDADWTQLIDYIIDEYDYHNDWHNDINGVGNALKSCRQVGSPLGGDCDTSEHPRWNSDGTHYGFDEFGFSAFPGGSKSFNGNFNMLGVNGGWWSSTEMSSSHAWKWVMGISNGNLSHGIESKTGGSSLRCVRDVPNLFHINLEASPIFAGTFSGAGYYEVGTEVNIVASSIEGWEFVNWTGDIQHLNNADSAQAIVTVPAEDVSLTAIFQQSDDSDIVYGEGVIDIEGNIYISVIIGDQEWMAQNLRVTKYKNGNSISTSWHNPAIGAYGIYPHGSIEGLESDEEVLQAFGALYNWSAVTNAAGLCPEGWSAPSDADWITLINYLSDQGFHNTDDTNGTGNALKSCRQVGSPLSGDCDTSEHPRWDSDGTHYGFDEFGFSALPGGIRSSSSGNYISIGSIGRWWSSTEFSTSTAYGRTMRNTTGNIVRFNQSKGQGVSVRCFRNID